MILSDEPDIERRRRGSRRRGGDRAGCGGAARRRADGRADARASTASRRPARSPPSTDPPRVLVLTTFDLDDVVYDALRAGASGFLLKDAPEERLITAIRVVADGGSLFAPVGDPSADRGVLDAPAAAHAACPRHADRPRDRGAAPGRARAVQRRDRRRAVRQREHREDPCRPAC